MSPNTYAIPEPLLAATIDLLNRLPAGQARQLLNALEAECTRQDRERADVAEAKKREQIAAEVRAELATPPAEEQA